MEKVQLGYIGCGFMGQKVHIPNFASIPECELVGLAEVRTELGEKFRNGLIYHTYTKIILSLHKIQTLKQ